ncbi:MAG: formate dehydrogenase [Gammaproteobacteria bacterium]|nr:formate dehydrogenase [Gammaproteobacteria bacterium]MYF37616.1 formate dehydrogenase [Gammaproteobacteria bacterium]
MNLHISDDSFARALGSESVEFALKTHGIEPIRTGSFGLAWLEPVVQIRNSDHRLISEFTKVSVEDVPAIVELLNSTQKQGNGDPPTSNPAELSVSSHPFYTKQHRLVFDRAGVCPPLQLPSFTLLENLLDQDPNQIIAGMETSWLRGRGGAGFPAFIKWRTVADTPADQKYVVCNADEGDSGTFSDRMLMEGDPFKLIEGMIIAGYATGATQGFIYLRSEYPVAKEYLDRALEIAYTEKLLGKNVLNSNFSFDIEVLIGAGAYICGEETSLLESLEGKRGQIKVKPPVPAIAGLFEKPTLVHNVISLAAVPGIFEIGPEAYAQLGVGKSTGTMPFQISGNVKQGGLIELPFGHTVNELVYNYGSGTASGRPVRTVQIGGPLGAYLSESEFDTPLTYEAMAEIGAGIGHGGLVVFDDTVNLKEQAEYAFEFCEIESCGKCTPCRIGSVRGKEALRQFSSNNVDARTLVVIEELCEVMEKASLCQMGGMTPIPVRSAIQKFPEDFIPEQ